MLMVISCRIFKDILTFVDFTKHIYLLPQRTHRTITFFICCSKIFDSQGTELVNNEIAVRTGNLYGNFLSRFIFSLDLTLHCSVSILFRHFSCLASSVIFSLVSRILCIASHLTERS